MNEKVRENNRLRQQKYLEAHREEVNDKRRERYHERLSNGICPRCGGRVRKGRTLCTVCSEYMLDLNRKYAKRNKTAAAKPAAKTAKPAAKTAARGKAKAPARAARPVKKAAAPKAAKRPAK